jgi:hypothetical protein
VVGRKEILKKEDDKENLIKKSWFKKSKFVILLKVTEVATITHNIVSYILNYYLYF